MVDASQLSSKSSRESALPVHAWTWARVFFLMSWQTSARKPATTTLSLLERTMETRRRCLKNSPVILWSTPLSRS